MLQHPRADFLAATRHKVGDLGRHAVKPRGDSHIVRHARLIAVGHEHILLAITGVAADVAQRGFVGDKNPGASLMGGNGSHRARSAVADDDNVELVVPIDGVGMGIHGDGGGFSRRCGAARGQPQDRRAASCPHKTPAAHGVDAHDGLPFCPVRLPCANMAPYASHNLRPFSPIRSKPVAPWNRDLRAKRPHHDAAGTSGASDKPDDGHPQPPRPPNHPLCLQAIPRAAVSFASICLELGRGQISA